MAFLQGYFQVPGKWIATRPVAVCDDGLGLSLRGETYVSTRQSNVLWPLKFLASGSPQAKAFALTKGAVAVRDDD